MNGALIGQRDTSEDYALLVGVSDYPHAGYSKLNGPPNDIEQMKAWLSHVDGGNVPAEHIKVLQSPTPVPADNPLEYPPTDREAWAWLKGVVFPGGGFKDRPGGRLYLFFSGHGFSNFMAMQHAALYMGNADRVQPCHVCGTNMANWCQTAAAFGEIVLVMDCCRDQEIAKNIEPAPFVEIRSAASRDVKVMEIYAVPYDGKAQERQFKRSGGKVLGVLTYALHHALWSASAKRRVNGVNVRDGYAIKSFIEGIWGSIVGQERIEAPEVVLPKRGDIVFSQSSPKVVQQTIRFSQSLAVDGSIDIIDTDGQLMDTAKLDPLARTCIWSSSNNESQVFDGEHVIVAQVPGLYEAVLKREGEPDRSVPVNMLGEDDVSFNI